MEKRKLTLIVIVLVLLALGFFVWKSSRGISAPSAAPESEEAALAPEASTDVPSASGALEEGTGLEVKVPEAGASVTSPLSVTGTIHGDGWSAFEGQAGTVELRDNKDVKVAEAPLLTNGEWMQLPVDFSATLTFSGASAGPATLVFKNENPSGNPENAAERRIPVTIPSLAE